MTKFKKLLEKKNIVLFSILSGTIGHIVGSDEVPEVQMRTNCP